MATKIYNGDTLILNAADISADYEDFKAGVIAAFISDNDYTNNANFAALLTYADSVAEKARLLRKAVLDRAAFNALVTSYNTNGGADLSPDAEIYYTENIVPKLEDLIKAMNNDVA